MNDVIQKTQSAGVVGAGGAGFPMHVKLGAKNVEYYLVNGAECEPLMRKDRELMTHFADEVIKGLQYAADTVGAEHRVVGLKSKHKNAVKALQAVCEPCSVDMHLMKDFYPAGDEYELVYAVTERLIPPQGLPLDVGCVVNNCETLYNFHRALEGIPVTTTFMTITGMVQNPLTTWVPVGMRVRDVLDLAGGATKSEFAVMESGLMMGRLITNLDQPVTKTTGGLIVLPADHIMIRRYSTTEKQQSKIGHSACDQCTYCTELCPRYLLGYDVEPHRVMRSLGFTRVGTDIWNEHALLCCRCGLCTLYACPEALYPREACVKGMDDLRAKNRGKWEGSKKLKVHPMKNARRVPVKLLTKHLNVEKYDADAAFVEMDIQPDLVRIPLQQHVGVPAEPTVKTGQTVSAGQVLGSVPEGKLGASVHAGISGTVSNITETYIEVKA